MAIGKKTGGRDFKPGQVANPNGRPIVPEEIKELRKLNRSEIEQLISDFMRKPLHELQAMSKNPATTALDRMIASVVEQAVFRGDHKRLNFLLDRLIGKVPDRLADADGQPIVQTFVDLIRIAAESKAKEGKQE
jgi:hypothetical protein